MTVRLVSSGGPSRQESTLLPHPSLLPSSIPFTDRKDCHDPVFGENHSNSPIIPLAMPSSTNNPASPCTSEHLKSTKRTFWRRPVAPHALDRASQPQALAHIPINISDEHMISPPHTISTQGQKGSKRWSNSSTLHRFLNSSAKRASVQSGRSHHYTGSQAHVSSVPDWSRFSSHSVSLSGRGSVFEQLTLDEDVETDRDDNLTLHIDPSPNQDGIYRSEEPVTGVVTLKGFSNDRKVAKVDVRLTGIAER